MKPQEATQIHTRLLQSTLDVEDSRAYWAHTSGSHEVDAAEAFEGYLFGARSMRRVKNLLTNLRARFDSFPCALRALHAWRGMDSEIRVLVCHWHLQLSDPLYRDFTGGFLVARREMGRPIVTRDVVVKWVEEQGPGRWTASTRNQFASKLLSAAYGAGLVATKRDPRPLVYPSVPDLALEYMLYLLREVQFEGTLLKNPYMGSVGLSTGALTERLRGLSGLRFRQQGDLVDFGWCFDDLSAWAADRLSPLPTERAS